MFSALRPPHLSYTINLLTGFFTPSPKPKRLSSVQPVFASQAASDPADDMSALTNIEKVAPLVAELGRTPGSSFDWHPPAAALSSLGLQLESNRFFSRRKFGHGELSGLLRGLLTQLREVSANPTRPLARPDILEAVLALAKKPSTVASRVVWEEVSLVRLVGSLAACTLALGQEESKLRLSVEREDEPSSPLHRMETLGPGEASEPTVPAMEVDGVEDAEKLRELQQAMRHQQQEVAEGLKRAASVVGEQQQRQEALQQAQSEQGKQQQQLLEQQQQLLSMMEAQKASLAAAASHRTEAAGVPPVAAGESATLAQALAAIMTSQREGQLQQTALLMQLAEQRGAGGRGSTEEEIPVVSHRVEDVARDPLRWAEYAQAQPHHGYTLLEAIKARVGSVTPDTDAADAAAFCVDLVESILFGAAPMDLLAQVGRELSFWELRGKTGRPGAAAYKAKLWSQSAVPAGERAAYAAAFATAKGTASANNRGAGNGAGKGGGRGRGAGGGGGGHSRDNSPGKYRPKRQ